MTPEENYEVLKKDFILKTAYHQKLLEEIKYEQLSEIGTKGLLAQARLEATTSYGRLVEIISEVKVNVYNTSSPDNKKE